jgi:hypothetical protein
MASQDAIGPLADKLTAKVLRLNSGPLFMQLCLLKTPYAKGIYTSENQWQGINTKNFLVVGQFEIAASKRQRKSLTPPCRQTHFLPSKRREQPLVPDC